MQVYGVVFWVVTLRWAVVKLVLVLRRMSRVAVTFEFRCIYASLSPSNLRSDMESIAEFQQRLVINPLSLPSWMYSCEIWSWVALSYLWLSIKAHSRLQWRAVELARRCVRLIWADCLQSSKSTRPRGWGWRQTVTMSPGREVAEKIRTHTENISIEPLSFCAGFVRMTQLSCE